MYNAGMKLTLPSDAPQVIKALPAAARAELTQLRRLVRHAPGWLSELEAQGDRLRVINAVMEDVRSRHTQLICADLRVYLNEATVYHAAMGFRVFDENHSVFMGLRGEKDPDLAIARAVRQEHGAARFERVSSWEPEFDRTGYDRRADPRSWGIGPRLVAEGVAFLLGHELEKTTPTPNQRQTPRL